MRILSNCYETQIKRIIYKILQYCLIWIREQELQDEGQMIIEIRAKHAPTLLKSQHSIIWQPGEGENRELKVSDWLDFETAHLIDYKKLKKLFKIHLPECEIKKSYKQGIPVLEILWPSDLSYEIVKDIELATKKQRVSATYGVLTLLTYQPNWITTGQSKKGAIFRRKIPMGFESSQIVIYEGDEATYLFNQNGLNYIQTQELEELKQNKEYIGNIPHSKGYENWKEEVKRYL